MNTWCLSNMNTWCLSNMSPSTHHTYLYIVTWLLNFALLSVEASTFQQEEIKVFLHYFIQRTRSKDSHLILLFHHIWNNGIDNF